MLKSVAHCVGKVFLGLGVYMLLILAGVFTILDTVCKMVVRMLDRLPTALIAFILCMAVVLSIGFLSGAGELREGWRVYTTVMAWVVAGVACWIISLLGPMAVGVAQFFFAVVNFGIIATYFSSAAKILAEKYMDLKSSDAEPWISIITFPYMVTEYAGVFLGLVAKAVAFIGTPVFVAGVGYWAFHNDAGVVEKGSEDWWFCVVFTALCGLLGLYLGIAASQAVSLGEEE